MKAMLLAAGAGRRLKPLTDTLPKPLLEVKGKSLIEHHLAHLQSAGIKDVVINVRHLASMIEAKLGDGSSHGINILWSREEQLLETGGGVKQALPLLGEEEFYSSAPILMQHLISRGSGSPSRLVSLAG